MRVKMAVYLVRFLRHSFSTSAFYTFGYMNRSYPPQSGCPASTGTRRARLCIAADISFGSTPTLPSHNASRRY